jgi:hypothetical protein
MNQSIPLTLLLGLRTPSSSSLPRWSLSSSSLSSPFFLLTGFCGTGGSAWAGGPILACKGAIRCRFDIPAGRAPPNLARTLDKSLRPKFIRFDGRQCDLLVCHRIPSGLCGLPSGPAGPGDCLLDDEEAASSRRRGSAKGDSERASCSFDFEMSPSCSASFGKGGSWTT